MTYHEAKLKVLDSAPVPVVGNMYRLWHDGFDHLWTLTEVPFPDVFHFKEAQSGMTQTILKPGWAELVRLQHVRWP